MKLSSRLFLAYSWVFDVLNALMSFIGIFFPVGIISKSLIYLSLGFRIKELIFLLTIALFFLYSVLLRGSINYEEVFIFLKIIMPPFIFLSISRIKYDVIFLQMLHKSMKIALFSYSLIFLFTFFNDIGYENYGESFFGTSSIFIAGNEVSVIIFLYQSTILLIDKAINTKVSNATKYILVLSSSIYILLGTLSGFIFFIINTAHFFIYSINRGFLSLRRGNLNYYFMMTVFLMLSLFLYFNNIIQLIIEELPLIVEKLNWNHILLPRFILLEAGWSYFEELTLMELFFGSGDYYMDIIVSGLQNNITTQLTYTKTSFEMDPFDIFSFAGLVGFVLYIFSIFYILKKVFLKNGIEHKITVLLILYLSIFIGHIWLVMPIVFSFSLYINLLDFKR